MWDTAWSGARAWAAAAANVPLVVGFTLLGAGVVLGRGVFDALSRPRDLLGAEEPAPRHNAGRIREQVRAAQQAARAAGVLGRGSAGSERR